MLDKKTYLIIVIIGGISILFGIYNMINSGESYTSFSGVFLGIVLVGSAYFSYSKSKEKGDE